MPESDRDILIEVRTDVKALVRDMTEPGGRVPRLEATVDEHGKSLSAMSGAVGMARWMIGAIITLTVGLLGVAGVVLDHILKGK